MGGKKSESNRKLAAVHARLTESEYKSLELMAGQEKRKISDMLRALIVEGARKRAILPTEAEMRREGVVFD